ncbi:MAG: hypothetical protein ABSC55_10920 [Syntrophorhabdales bacterium]
MKHAGATRSPAYLALPVAFTLPVCPFHWFTDHFIFGLVTLSSSSEVYTTGSNGLPVP